MRTVALLFALLSVLAACDSSGGNASETDIDRCSNGVDDDGDGLIDCADVGCAAYAFCIARDAGRVVDGGVSSALPDGSMCAFDAVDLVFVLDVSGTMRDELLRLRDALATLEGLPVQVSMVVFVDDALAVRGCMPFDDLDAVRSEIDSWRVRAEDNTSPVSGIVNQDCAENGIDALFQTATVCSWRAGAARVVVYVTEDTFAERPTVLSGPYGPGVVVQRTYSEAVDALRAVNAQVVSVTLPGSGESCGAGRSPNVGQGFHEPYRGMEPIPSATDGLALSIQDLRTGQLDLGATLRSLRGEVCTDATDDAGGSD